ncbi:MAG: COX15/CtaA family protein [Micromonosporaceae bacterium]
MATDLTVTQPGSPVEPSRAKAAARLVAFLWQPTPTSMRRLALAGVVVNAGIIVTGAAVRLSESGLGCPDWPACTTRSLVASRTPGQAMANTWIEFGNRLVTFIVMAVAVAVFVAAWRLRVPGSTGKPTRRTDLLWLAAAQPASVVLQAVLGGITVLTALNPAMVSTHFLVSMAIVGLTVVLYVRCAEGVAPARPLVRADVRLLSVITIAVAGLMFAAGTVVTGSGPLAGNAASPRYHLPLERVTQFHADVGWLFAGLAVALAITLKFSGAPPRAVRLGWMLLGIMGAQGVLGYVQYFTGLPPVLVGIHVLGSVLVWIIALRLFFALRDRGSITDADGGSTSGDAKGSIMDATAAAVMAESPEAEPAPGVPPAG